MTDELTTVPAENPLLTAMVFLAALAYPEDWTKRDRAIESMKALVFRAAKTRGQLDRLPAEKMTRQQMENTLRLLTKRIDKRLQASTVCADLLMRIKRPGKPHRLAPTAVQATKWHLRKAGIPEARVSELAATTRATPGKAWSLNDHAKHGPARFKSDAWRPEVMHLAMALNSVKRKWSDPRGRPFSVATLLFNPEWVIPAIRSAEASASYWPHVSNMPTAFAV